MTVMLDPANNIFVTPPPNLTDPDEHRRVIQAGGLLAVLNQMMRDYRVSYIFLASED